MSNVTESLSDNIMEGDSNDGLEFGALFISDNSSEIINALIEKITVSSSEDKPEDPEICVPDLSAAEVSESSGDEGEDDLDRGEPEKRESQQGDDRTDPGDIHVLEDAAAEEDEFTMMWGKLGPQPDKGQVNLVKKNWRIEVNWQDLRLAIIDVMKIMEQLGNLRKYQTASLA